MTPREFKEEWLVDTGEVFLLNERQVEVLKQATLRGDRGLVWFEKFAISIPHIKSVVLSRREAVNQLNAPKEEPISEEKRQENIERLKKMKEDIFKR